MSQISYHSYSCSPHCRSVHEAGFVPRLPAHCQDGLKAENVFCVFSYFGTWQKLLNQNNIAAVCHYINSRMYRKVVVTWQHTGGLSLNRDWGVSGQTGRRSRPGKGGHSLNWTGWEFPRHGEPMACSWHAPRCEGLPCATLACRVWHLSRWGPTRGNETNKHTNK